VTASWDKTARVWDAATGKPVGKPIFVLWFGNFYTGRVPTQPPVRVTPEGAGHLRHRSSAARPLRYCVTAEGEQCQAKANAKRSIKESFRFLLAREPNTSMLRSFHVTTSLVTSRIRMSNSVPYYRMGIDSTGDSRHNDPNVIRSHPPPMSTHPLAGKPAPRDLLINVSRLEAAFYEAKPDLADPNRQQLERDVSRRSERRSSHPLRHARNCDSQRKYTSVDQCYLYSCRLNPIVDKGGSVKQSECERPCQGIGSA
jgi:hypothetical protein